jgi:hypothetical protein
LLNVVAFHQVSDLVKLELGGAVGILVERPLNPHSEFIFLMKIADDNDRTAVTPQTAKKIVARHRAVVAEHIHSKLVK